MSTPLAEAKERALRYLERQDRTCLEVRTRLERYGYSSEVVEEVTAWLVALGYIDDERYAEAFAREKRRAGWGGLRIRQVLLRKGIAGELAKRVTQDNTIPESLVELVRRRFGTQARTDPRLAYRRASAFLARRGHDFETISDVVRRALGTEEESGPEAG